MGYPKTIGYLGEGPMSKPWPHRATRYPGDRASVHSSFWFVAVVSVMTGAVVAPQTVGAQSEHALAQAPAFAVGIERCTFTDHTRRVINYSTAPHSVLSTNRTLVTEIRYPAQYVPGGPTELAGAPPVAQSGGYPVIVFAHGYDVTPDTYAALLDSWTRAGFVVVAPFFPDEQRSEVTAQRGVNTEGDLVNEPADLAFVTKSIVDAATSDPTACPIVSGLVRVSAIALAGHSDGATAVGMLAYDRGVDPQGVSFASLRTGLSIRAIIVLSGDEDTAQPYGTEASEPNLLVIHSLTDQCNPIRNGVKIYDAVHQPNKWFLELRTAHHLPPFDGADTSAFNVVVASSIRFLQISLDGMSFPTRYLAFANEWPSIARMYVGGLGGAKFNPPRLAENCGLN